MTAITLSQDQFKSKGLRVVLSSVESGKWSVSASITISAHEKEFFNERCTFEKLPLMICYCLVEMYLDYGPKDYETYGSSDIVNAGRPEPPFDPPNFRCVSRAKGLRRSTPALPIWHRLLFVAVARARIPCHEISEKFLNSLQIQTTMPSNLTLPSLPSVQSSRHLSHTRRHSVHRQTKTN